MVRQPSQESEACPPSGLTIGQFTFRTIVMNIALCYESVLPARGGCETYIADLTRRLVVDEHELHLYACRRDATALPGAIHYHELPRPRGPRFLRPWRFAEACEEALAHRQHDVSIGFDKTWGQDILYPQGGLHLASVSHNLLKYRSRTLRSFARLAKQFDLAQHSFAALERRQYLGPHRPLIIVNSDMVCRHFQHYYGIPSKELRVVRSAIDPGRFTQPEQPRLRMAARQQWGIGAKETVALFVAMNYRLKGLDPLLHAVHLLPNQHPFRLLVAGKSQTRRYQRLAQHLGIADRVLFLGPRPDVQNCYFAADFLVHPTFYDPCSLVVLEALACGLPVITTRYNGASELLHPPSEGYVIADPHNHSELAWSMEQLLDRDRRKACAQVARQTASEWTFEHHYRRLMKVFAEAAARKQAA